METTVPGNLRPIQDVWAGLPDCNCFCCGQSHEWGFRLRFFYDPEPDAVVSLVPPIKAAMAGWPGIVHGGFSAMLLDEIMAWGVMHFAGKTAFTGRMEIRFVAPVRTGMELRLEARAEKITRRLVKMTSRLLLAGSDTLLSEAEGTYVIPNLKEFKENFGIDDVPDEFLKYLRS